MVPFDLFLYILHICEPGEVRMFLKCLACDCVLQKITKSLENQMLTFKHEDYVAKKAEKKDQAEESGTPEGIITAQQAEGRTNWLQK